MSGPQARRTASGQLILPFCNHPKTSLAHQEHSQIILPSRFPPNPATHVNSTLRRSPTHPNNAHKMMHSCEYTINNSHTQWPNRLFNSKLHIRHARTSQRDDIHPINLNQLPRHFRHPSQHLLPRQPLQIQNTQLRRSNAHARVRETIASDIFPMRKSRAFARRKNTDPPS